MAKNTDSQCKLVIFTISPEKKYEPEKERLNSIKGVTASDNVRPQNLLLRMIRRIHILSGLPGIGIWLGDWKEKLPACDTLICMANPYSPHILCWVKKHYPSIRCINYYWDEVVVSGYPVVKTENFENWSFCRWDCEQYGFSYNPQFYVNSVKLQDCPQEYDVVFVGADREGKWKSRVVELNKFLELFRKEDLTSYIWFVSDNPGVPKEIRKDHRIPVEEYRLATAKAKAVLELVDPENPWITQRPLLALNNGKKVITNNASIREEKYYSTANVFILGVDSDDRLKKFIDSPFEKVPEEALHYYEVSEWIKRFS